MVAGCPPAPAASAACDMAAAPQFRARQHHVNPLACARTTSVCFTQMCVREWSARQHGSKAVRLQPW
ncbi:hypothetical protein EON67_07390 [archaeon]|nr:MAG: hypothetical protein EON67_07390 [archaeon]